MSEVDDTLRPGDRFHEVSDPTVHYIATRTPTLSEHREGYVWILKPNGEEERRRFADIEVDCGLRGDS